MRSEGYIAEGFTGCGASRPADEGPAEDPHCSRRLDRRAVLRNALAVGALGCSGVATAETGDPLAGEALFADVRRYAAFGDHQTATEADHRTSEWLNAELGRAGLKSRLSPWTHQQFFIVRQGLRLEGGGEIASFPLWWPSPTGPDPVRAPLADLQGAGALSGKIAVVGVPPVVGASILPGGDIGRFVVEAARRKAVGLVIVTRDPAGDIVALNAMSGLSQWPIPVICVGGRDEARLQQAVTRGEPAELLIDGRIDYAATAYEVIGELRRGPRRVVVTTPSSGWFQCAGERGPGIALWLGLARWAARQRNDISYTFVASSGHEMESMGVRHFMGSGAPPAADTISWIHLGAGIATYAYRFGPDGPVRLSAASAERRLMTNTSSFMPHLKAQFDGLPGLSPHLASAPGGEMVVMARQGYKVWGFAGGSAFHHMPGDRPERITGPEILEPVARATAAALAAIVKSS